MRLHGGDSIFFGLTVVNSCGTSDGGKNSSPNISSNNFRATTNDEGEFASITQGVIERTWIGHLQR